MARARVKSIEKNDTQVAIEELEHTYDKMLKDKEDKLAEAKKQLIDMIEVTVDKYRTATGTAEALRVMRFTAGEDKCYIKEANELAHDMAMECFKMAKKASKLKPEEMDKLCDGFYEKNFGTISARDLAFEMMRIDLCRNVGGSAEDMVGFVARIDEEIEKTKEKLAELKAEKAE